MPLKLQYGRPPVPQRKGQMRTTQNMLDKYKADSEKDAAFVKNIMKKHFAETQGRFEEPKPTMAEKMRVAVKRDKWVKKTRRKPPARITRAGKRRKTRRKRKRKRTRRKRKRKRRRKSKRRR
jgi:hypothetical protein